MSSRYRLLWTSLKKFNYKINYRTLPTFRGFNKMPRITVPCTIGFSIFTWLGFDKKVTAEDELITTIKHCVLFIQRNEYIKAEQLLHVALRQAQQIQHQLGITYLYDIMANLALEREQLDKAKKLFVAVSQRLLADGAKEDDPRIVHISVKLARICHLDKDYTTAQLGYDWCLEKLNAFPEKESNDFQTLISLAEDWYGRLLIDINQHEKGLQYMISALNRMRNILNIDKEHIVVQLNDIGIVYDKLGKVDESIDYLKESVELGKPLDLPDLGAMYINLGRAYMKKNLYDEARRNCGHGWKLGVLSKNNTIKKEAESCIKELKQLS